MPKRSYVTQEKSLPEYKPVKDRLMSLLCGNVSGDFKLNLLLVYHSENPQLFKKNNILEQVECDLNITAWVARQCFIEVFAKV